ncbi:hypothetical protein GKAS_03720 [Kluyvera ascorbata ATCC 33433]|nr:hypothetical protein [Kluyvera ascorbata]EJG2387542.1 hypothetical protein [Kluyvera ascorbata]KFC98627.1 hypothetical protein GKAS_03720 [Kluyvera ascorbata ATCC 33433]MDU1195265.1 hypothetical protein [Kluyvera ascorbata]STW99033.1 Uncharacterised protein [Kluyvera ascorbata]BCA39826.1 hypothetical protein KATP_23480 [Kluyvera ascorbata]
MEVLGLPGHQPTIVFARIEKLVKAADSRLIQLVTKWSFMTAGPKFEVERFDGSKISFQGIKFAGTTVDVFWRGFIEPYIENESVHILEQAGELASECGILPETVVNEARCLLQVMVRRVYEQMAEVDRTLRGDGLSFPDKRDVTSYIAAMSAYIDSEAKIVVLKASKNRGQLAPNFHFSGLNNAQIQIGDNNNQLMQISVHEFVEKIAKSGDQEAKSLLAKVLENSTVASVIGAGASALFSLLK